MRDELGPDDYAALEAALTGEGAHLEYEELAAIARGAAPTSSQSRHLDGCAVCASLVRDFVELAPGAGFRVPRWWRAVAVAAGLIVIVTAAMLLLREAPARPSVATWSIRDEAGMVAMDGASDAPADVVAVWRSGSLALPASVASLLPAAGLLRGAVAADSVRVIAPVGTRVREDRPRFRWKADVPCRVEVFDDGGRLVAESVAMAGHEWQPPAPLPRGRSYVWQLGCERRGKRLITPRPPAPEARFGILSEEEARAVEMLRGTRRGWHTVLFVRELEIGLLDDAREELRALRALPQDDRTRKRIEAFERLLR
jgi:hypothetical protein